MREGPLKQQAEEEEDSEESKSIIFLLDFVELNKASLKPVQFAFKPLRLMIKSKTSNAGIFIM